MTLGIMNQERAQILTRMVQAMHDQNENNYRTAMEELMQNVQQSVLDEARELVGQNDVQILASRGVRLLTSAETKYYNKVIEAMRSDEPRQALTNLDVVMPETVIDSVFENLRTNHPLLSKINFQNTQSMIKFLINKNPYQKALWGKLTAAVTKELSSDYDEINMETLKLSAFIAVSKSMLDLGPAWLDRYVREVLYEALANGFEDSVINNLKTDSGTIGMIADLSKGTAQGNVITYTAKTAVKITDLAPTTIGNLLSGLAQDENGKARIIKDVILIVNPIDYFAKIFPSTTVLGADGTYRNDVLPYPMTVIQSPAVEQGKAVFGLAYRYFAGLAKSSKDGKIEYSDEYQFLEDNRVYLIKLYANGMPLDNNAFVLLDISELKQMIIKVEMVTPEEVAAEASAEA